MPHHDTFRRFFEKLDPQIVEQKLTQWVQKFVVTTNIDNRIWE
ncbi:hypothetical protein [Oscillatoria sp. HE19RPO]